MGGKSLYFEKLAPKQTVFGASFTKASILSDVVALGAEDTKYLTVVVKASGVTAGAGITVYLQHSYDPAGTFIDYGTTISVTGNGYFVIRHVFNPGTVTLLDPYIKIAVETGAGSALTIDEIKLSRRPT